MDKHEWPLIRHEEHQKGVDRYMVDLYVQGEKEVHIVQLDSQELKAYTSIRSGEFEDPLQTLVSALLIPERELSILFTGDYYEEKNKKATPVSAGSGAQGTQGQDKGDSSEEEV